MLGTHVSSQQVHVKQGSISKLPEQQGQPLAQVLNGWEKHLDLWDSGNL